MPVVRAFATKFLRIADEVPKQTLLALKLSAAEVEKDVLLASGKYAGKRIVRTQSVIGSLGGDPTALVRMSSPLAHLLDHDTKPHLIQAGALTGRRTKAPLLYTPYGFFLQVNHPGTKGKLMWEIGLAAAMPVIIDTMNGALGNAIIAAFGG